MLEHAGRWSVMVKRYSETFKREAVRTVREGTSVTQVATQTGASVYSLRDWVRAAEQAERERPATKEEMAEIRRLKRRVAELEEEKVILKKAAALFAKEPQ